MDGNNKYTPAIQLKRDNPRIIQLIDQRFLPEKMVVEDLYSVNDVVMAITDSHITDKALIKVAASYGMYLASLHAPQNNEFDRFILDAGARLQAAQPTAVDLKLIIERQLNAICHGKTYDEKISIALRTAQRIAWDHKVI